MKKEYTSRLQPFLENHINAWKESNISQSAYCDEHALVVHRFGYWKLKLTIHQNNHKALFNLVHFNRMLLSQHPHCLYTTQLTTD